MPIELKHRIAQPADIPAIVDLMRLSITENMKSFLNAAEIESAKETMGMDQSLIADGTYIVIEVNHEGDNLLVGCGGWGKRKTL